MNFIGKIKIDASTHCFSANARGASRTMLAMASSFALKWRHSQP